jgi:hypothetical protein
MKKRFGEVVTGVIVGLLVAAITALASYLIQLPLTTLLTVTVGASIIAAVGVASSLAWSRSHARARATRYLRSPPVAASEYLPIGPSGARWTPVGEILADPNLIVAQPWTQLSSPATRSQNNLSHVLLDHICSGSAAIVLGEPGIGKSLTIRQTFGLLAERYLSDPSRNPLPVLIPLGELPIATSPRDSADGDDPLDLTGVVATLTGIHPRAVRRLVRNEGLTLLLDALDESPALRSVNSMRAAARGAAFASVGLISSRGDHFQGFFALPGLAERFTLTTQLGPIPFDVRVPKFVHSYCRHFGLDRAAAILGFLESDEGHRDLTARPLTLWMIVDVLASLPSENHFSAVTLTSLYSQYSDKWLRIEAAKSGTQVLALADRRLLVRLAARSMFQAGTALGGSMRSTADLAATRSELAEFLAGADAGALLHALISRYGLDVLTDEICGRTFLVRGGYRDNYRFTHKSFFEYFVALDLRECLLGERRLDAATKYLERPLSDPIVYFFREMLAELRQYPDLSRLIA